MKPGCEYVWTTHMAVPTLDSAVALGHAPQTHDRAEEGPLLQERAADASSMFAHGDYILTVDGQVQAVPLAAACWKGGVRPSAGAMPRSYTSAFQNNCLQELRSPSVPRRRLFHCCCTIPADKATARLATVRRSEERGATLSPKKRAATSPRRTATSACSSATPFRWATSFYSTRGRRPW